MTNSAKDNSDLDWRVGAVTRLAEDLQPTQPGGAIAKAGSRLFLSCLGDGGQFGRVGFIAPSPVALAMNLSLSASRTGEALKPTFKLKDSPSPEGLVKTVELQSSTALYDYFEYAMVSVFFAYQALESFSNDEIFRKASEPIEIKIRKKTETLTRREAERKLSTSEKLGTLLPNILNIPTMKGKALWEKFRELEEVRDNVAHLKNQTVHDASRNTENEKVLFTLLANDLARWPRIAMYILEYFIRGSQPDWFKELQKHVI